MRRFTHTRIIVEMVERRLYSSIIEECFYLYKNSVLKIQRYFRDYLVIREARVTSLKIKWLNTTQQYRKILRRSFLREENLVPKNILEFFIKLFIKLKIWEYLTLTLLHRSNKFLRRSYSIQSTDSLADLEVIDRALGKHDKLSPSSRSTILTIFSDTEGLREIQQMTMQNRFQWDRIASALDYDDLPSRPLGYKKKIRIILAKDSGSRGSQFITVFTSGQPVETIGSLASSLM